MTWPEKLKNLRPYQPEAGVQPIRLDANESFLPPPDWLRTEIRTACEQIDWNRYPDAQAAALRQAASVLYGIPAEQIVAGNGSDELIGLIAATFVPAGGRVLTSAPDFSMYRFYADLYGLHCQVTGKDGRRPDVNNLLEEHRRHPADLILFSNPCNPTGLGLPRQETLRLVRQADCLVVVDEAYMDFWDQSILTHIGAFDNLIVLKTCSKAYGMAAFRLGFALSSPQIARMLDMTRSPFNVNAFTQAAGRVALSYPEHLRACTAQILRAREELYQRLRAVSAPCADRVEVLPTETNFVLLKTKQAPELFAGLKDRGILVRRIGTDILRITAGRSEEHLTLTDALAALLPVP